LSLKGVRCVQCTSDHQWQVGSKGFMAYSMSGSAMRLEPNHGSAAPQVHLEFEVLRDISQDRPKTVFLEQGVFVTPEGKELNYAADASTQTLALTPR